jgi:hypothetical protein
MRRSLPRRTKQALICLLLLWISGGCYLPIQQIPTDARENMPAGSLNFEPGVSSRSDVLLHMGEPDEISPDEAVFTYRWPSIDGIIVVTQCTPPIENYLLFRQHRPFAESRCDPHVDVQSRPRIRSRTTTI